MRSLALLLLAVLLATTALFARGAAIITLEMPVGARQLGMAEVGVAGASDANTLFYNPAGLAFGPLSSEWELTLPREAKDAPWFTALAARTRSGFLAKSELWAGTPTGMQHFDGRKWLDFHTEVLEGAARVRDVVRTFIGSEENLDSLTAIVKKLNQVQSESEESFLVEVRMPWSLVIHDSVTSMLYEDRTEKLWVGTTKGLFRFDGKGWKSFKTELGQNRITALTTQGATLWVGTSNGLFSYRNGAFEQKGKVLPSQYISSLAWSEMRQELYVATKGAGIARLQPKKDDQSKDRWNMYSMEDGLMDLEPSAVVVDSSGHVWVAHKEGLSHFNLRKWEQIRFENNTVHTLAVATNGALWIGTDKGAWWHMPSYATAKGRKAEKETSTKDQESNESNGEWAHFHTGNGMSSNHVWTLLPQSSDVWFSTAAGMERFNAAEYQLSFFYEKLLPVLNIPDLYHIYAGTTFPAAEWGTIGAFVNFISFGQTTVSGETDASTQSTFNSSETVGDISYGTRLSKNWGLGLNFKFFYSSLSAGASAGEPAATTTSYAVDIGLLGKNIYDRLSVGVVLANIGPNVYYLDKSNDDPIPLTWRLGIGYTLIETVDHHLAIEADYNRQVIYTNSRGEAEPFYISAWKAWANPDDKLSTDGAGDILMKTIEAGVFGVGAEYIYANTVALRGGYLYDKLGKRQELHWGLGVMLSDVLQVDLASIQGIGTQQGVRDGQMRFGLLFKF